MKAIRIEPGGTAADFMVREVPEPKAGPGEVLVEIHAIRLADEIPGGPDPHGQEVSASPPGRYAAGHIRAVGEGVKNFSVGAPVFIDSGNSHGCYAEFVALPKHSVFPLPDAFDLDVAACLPDYMLAHSIFGEGTRGLAINTVYVPASPLNTGTALIQLGMLAGWNVIASAESAAHTALLADAGAKLIFDSTSVAPANRIMEWTDGTGVNLIVEHRAGAGLEDNLRLLADFGDLFSCGWDQGDPPDFHRMMWRNLDRCPRVRIWSLERYRNDRAGKTRLVNEVIDLMQSHRIRPPVLNRMALDEAGRAHRLSTSGEIVGNVVLKPKLGKAAA